MTMNCGLPNHWVCCNVDIECCVGYLVHHHRGDETLSISAGEDECCAPEWCYITSLGPPYPVTCEELIRAYYLVPVTIRIKSNIVTIAHF